MAVLEIEGDTALVSLVASAAASGARAMSSSSILLLTGIVGRIDIGDSEGALAMHLDH
jgi:hypothetical protein